MAYEEGSDLWIGLNYMWAGVDTVSNTEPWLPGPPEGIQYLGCLDAWILPPVEAAAGEPGFRP